MSIEVLILGLNMDAVNALIWCSAVIAKFGVLTALIMGIFYLGVFFMSLLDG